MDGSIIDNQLLIPRTTPPPFPSPDSESGSTVSSGFLDSTPTPNSELDFAEMLPDVQEFNAEFSSDSSTIYSRPPIPQTQHNSQTQQTTDQKPTTGNPIAESLQKLDVVKPSTGLTFEGIEEFMAKYKITSTLLHIRTFVQTDKTSIKIAALLATLQNYQSKSMLREIDAKIATNPNIASLFTWILGFFTTSGKPRVPSDFQLQSISVPDFVLQYKFDAIKEKYDPMLPIEEQPPTVKSVLEEFDKYMPILRPMLGAIAFFACSFGFHKLLDFSFLSETSKSVVQLASTIRAKRVIKEEVETGVDDLLSLLYSSLGGEYISPKVQKIKRFSDRVEQLRSRVQSYIDKSKVDAFGLLRIESFESLSKELIDIRKDFQLLSERESSSFNFNNILHEIGDNIRALTQRRIDLLKGYGKQVPVRIWFCGAPDMGKSYIAIKLANLLCGKGGFHTFTPSDEYWSGYCGQIGVVFDDILQNPEAIDADQWMQLSTAIAKHVNMAAVSDKGTPFTSRFLIATSNFHSLTEGKHVKSLAAFNRRRDFLVFVISPEISAYRKTHKQSPPPEWFRENNIQPRLFLFDTMLAQEGQTIDFSKIPDTNTPGFFGEVTFDELAKMSIELEKSYAEEYRQDIIRRNVSTLINVPREPIEYDSSYFIMDKLFDKVTKQKKFDFDKGPPLFEAQTTLSQQTDDSDFMNQSNLVPVRSSTKTSRKALLLGGPPGIGKTHLVQEALDTSRVGFVKLTKAYYEAHQSWYTELKGQNVILWFEDFTNSRLEVENFKSVLDSMNKNEFPCLGVLATWNPTLITNKDEVSVIRRRCHCIDINLTTYAAAKCFVKQMDVAAYLQGFTNPVERMAQLQHAESNYTTKLAKSIQILQHELIEFCKFDATTKKYETFKPFTLPHPRNYDVLIKFNVPHIASAFDIPKLIGACEIFEKHGDDFEPVSSTDVLRVVSKLGPLLNTKAFGNINTFTTIFNQEKHKPVTPHHLLVVLGDTVKFGFMPVDDQVIAYGVDEDDDINDIIIHDDIVLYKGERISFPRGNEQYEKVIMKTFSTDYVPMSSIVQSGEPEILRTLVRLSPVGDILHSLIAAIPVIAQGFAIAAILKDMAERKESSSEDEEEDMEEERKRRKKKKFARMEEERAKRIAHQAQKAANENTDNEINDNKHPRNVVLERSKRTPHVACPKVIGNSDEERNDNKQKQAYIVERKARTAHIAQPTKTGNSDEEHNDDKTKVKVIQERKARQAHVVQPTVVGNSDEERNDNQHKKNFVLEDGYDTVQRPKRNVVVCESSKDLPDGSLCYNEEEDYIGFAFNDQIIYLLETVPNTWIVTAVPRNELWSLVEWQGLKKCYTKKKVWQLKPTTLSGEEQNIKHLLGYKFTVDPTREWDMDSIFAFTFSCGLPYSYLHKQLEIDALTHFFGPASPGRIPHKVRERVSQIDPKILENLKVELEMQGMMDPMFLTQYTQASKNAVEILSEGTSIVHGIGIGSNRILTVSHIADVKDLYIYRKNRQWPITLVALNQRSDLAIYEIPDKSFEAFPNISHLFIAREELKKILATATIGIPTALVVTNDNGDTRTHHVQYGCTDATLIRTEQPDGKHITYSAKLGGYRTTGLTINGDCGSLLYMLNKTLTGRIVALHRAGNQCTSMACALTREWVQEMIETPASINAFNNESLPTTEKITTFRHNSQLELFSQARVCKHTGLLWVGRTAKTIYHPTSTRIHRTGITIPGYDGYEPAIMSKHDPRAQGWDPMKDGLKRYGTRHNENTLNAIEINEAFYEIGMEIVNLLKRNKEDVRVFSSTEAVNTPSIFEYPVGSPIDRSGSAGFPHTTTPGTAKKGDHLFQNPKTGQWQFKSSSRYVQDNINQLIVDARNGKHTIIPTIAYVKDESLKLKKTRGEKKKSRLFFSCPFEYLIAFRRYNVAALNRIMGHYNELPIKVGISSNFADWHTLGTQLEKVNDWGFCSDMENFDSTLSREFISGAGDVMSLIYTHCSTRGEDPTEGNKIRNVLNESMSGAYVIANRDLYKLDQAQVSGNPATAVWNSLCVWALFYLVWNKLARQHNKALATYTAFRKNVALAIYGDDNACTVSPDCKWFNFNSFKRVAAEYGFKITDIAKSGNEIPDFVHISEFEFLKRQFQRIQGKIVGPLALTSIAKSLQWIRDGSYNINQQHVDGGWPIAQNREIINQSIDAMWCELALHGEETYRKWVDQILPQAQNNALTITPPSWKEAMSQKGYMVYSTNRLST